MKPTWIKKDMRDSRGYPMTQALFLETVYSPYAIWTFDDEDKEYTYPDGEKRLLIKPEKKINLFFCQLVTPPATGAM